MTNGVPANQIYYGNSPVAYASTSSASGTVGQLEHGFIQSFLGWGGRISAGRAIDEVYHSQRGIAQAAPRAGTSYSQILGLTDPYLPDGSKNPAYTGVKSNLEKLNPKAIARRLSQEDINGGRFTVGRYAKETLYEYNLKGLGNYKADPGGSLARGLGLAYEGWNVGKDTLNGYKAAKAKHGDNDLAVAASTTGTCAVSLGKGAITWESSTLGLKLGEALLPGMTFAKIPFGGVMMGAVFAVATGMALDKMIPPPKAPGKSQQDGDATYEATHQALQQGNPFSGSGTLPQVQSSYVPAG